MDIECYWLLRCGDMVFTTKAPNGSGIFPRGYLSDFGSPDTRLPVGEWQGLPCYALDIERIPEHIPGELTPLRPLYGLGGEVAFALAGRASMLLDWHRNHRFCGHCGTATAPKTGEFAMECPACGLLAYPRISPAVMVLIARGNELLLARSPRFRPGVFSALAGFVEAGETVEECAVREVREEVGLEISNLRYFRSQPWPFPDSLMIAFFADYAGGEIVPEPSEIEAAGWFSRDDLPPLPDYPSIARHLIDAACRA